MGKIPKPIANALLAGVLLKLCLAPALALGSIPALMIPVILAWIVGLRLNRLAAMPLAVLTMAVVLAFTVDFDGARAAFSAGWLPVLAPSTPVFNPVSMLSVGLPLYLVTMADRISGLPPGQQLPARRPPAESDRWQPSAPGGPCRSMSAITAGDVRCGCRPGKHWAATERGQLLPAGPLAGVTAMALAPTAIIGIAGLARSRRWSLLRSAFSEPGQLRRRR